MVPVNLKFVQISKSLIEKEIFLLIQQNRVFPLFGFPLDLKFSH